MGRRLVDRFRPGQAVEITFDGRRWLAGRVVRLAHPGIWVETADGRQWFVTHTGHVRLVARPGA